jgi:hypothetical protein
MRFFILKKSVLLMALFLSDIVHAEDAAKNAYMIEKFDHNGDRVVTQEEFLESAAQRFKTMDIDGDHAIEQAEFLQRYAEHSHPTTTDSGAEVGQRVFDKLDDNHDAQISEQEYNQSRLKWFTEVDKDNDQRIELGK